MAELQSISLQIARSHQPISMRKYTPILAVRGIWNLILKNKFTDDGGVGLTSIWRTNIASLKLHEPRQQHPSSLFVRTTVGGGYKFRSHKFKSSPGHSCPADGRRKMANLQAAGFIHHGFGAGLPVSPFFILPSSFGAKRQTPLPSVPTHTLASPIPAPATETR